MGMDRNANLIAGLLLMFIVSSFTHSQTDFSFKDPLIKNIFATKTEQCSTNDSHCVEEADNQIPIADAGAAQTVKSGDQVHLDGTDSYDPDCKKNGNTYWCDYELTYEWERIDHGPEITYWDRDSYDAEPTFTAPSVEKTTKLTFSLAVSDGYDHSDPDNTVTITVEPKIEGHLLGNLLALKIQVEKNQIKAGDKQTITITAIDKSSNKQVVDATIQGKVTYHNHEIEKFSDSDGEATYSWNIDSKPGTGTFKVTADASAEGYEPGYESMTFDVINEQGRISGGTTSGSGGTTLSQVQSTADQLGNTFYSTLSKIKDPVSVLKQNDLSRLLPLVGLGVAAIGGATAYGKYRSRKSQHKGSNVEVITRGGLE
jgi:K319L-like, PKD domain